MADLILLNGPPASGKSTLAQRHVHANPMTLNLDIDVLRGLIGGWADAPETTGLAARALALVMAQEHLAAGHNVIVPQFLGRPDFIDQLSGVAAHSDARFVEIGLCLDRSEAISAFVERSAAPATQAHVDAAKLVEQSTNSDPIGATYDAFVALIATRPQTVRVDVTRGNVGDTYQALMEALA